MTIPATSDGSFTIAVLRALKLGDMLCAVPFFRALRAKFPAAKIVLIGLPWASEFTRRFAHLIDDYIELPGFPGLPERHFEPVAFVRFLAGLVCRNIDLAIQAHGSGQHVNDLIALLGAKKIAGFYEPGRWCPDTAGFLPYPTHLHEIWRLMRLAQHLDVPTQGDEMEFPIFSSDVTAAAALIGNRKPYVVLHPGCISAVAWPPEKFREIGVALAARGYDVVVTGSLAEADLAEYVARGIPNATSIAGMTELGVLGAVLSESKLLICNDTGASHLAAALRVPSVVIFSELDRQGWPPLDRQQHRFLSDIEGVSVRRVLEHSEDLLDRPAKPNVAPVYPSQHHFGASLYA